jgi:sialidase-1
MRKNEIATRKAKTKQMKIIIAILLFFLNSAGLYAQQSTVPVFVSGYEGHKSYRIPAIISLPNGNLLAFCEGRVNHSGDSGDINIVLKRSSDKGKTWTALQTIVDVGDLGSGNPAPVLDLTDPAYPKGRIFLFYNTENANERAVKQGKGLREVWYKTSTDNGVTWSEPTNITTQTHRPKQPLLNPAYNFDEDWRWYAVTPGHAMQFSAGLYKGRMFVAANHSSGDPQPHSTDYKAHGFYTDDHGKTFHLSEDVNMPGSNESTAAELSRNRIMMNIRNQKGDIKNRIVAISNNGGQTWDTIYFDKNLPDPVCQGSILTIGKRKGNTILAFCNSADTEIRDNLTLRISNDDGKTWFKNIVIDQKRKNGNTAYSDIVKMSSKKIGVLYEKDNYGKIMFTIVKW